MASVGDILRITDCQTLFGQEVCNILYYVVSIWTGNNTLDDVIDEFINDYVSVVRQRQHPDLAHTEFKVENITNGLDFAIRSDNIPGTNPTSTEAAPSFNAFSVTKNRTSKLTRSGSARIAGVSEGDMDGNDSTLSAAEKQQLEDALTAQIIKSAAPDEFTLDPVIVGVLANGDPDLSRVQPFTTASFRGISSQVSRKNPIP